MGCKDFSRIFVTVFASFATARIHGDCRPLAGTGNWRHDVQSSAWCTRCCSILIPTPTPSAWSICTSKDKAGQDRWLFLTGPQYQQFRNANSVESAVAEDQWNLTTTGGDLPEDVNAVYFTGNGFNHFGVPALLGRGLVPADAPEGQDPQPVAVLGYEFWQRHYNGERDIVGKTIQLVHKNYTIVGVAQPRFTWGDGDVYLPLKLSADPVRTYQVDTKLKPGVSHATANAEFQSLFEQFAKETPKHFPADGFRMDVWGLNDQFVRDLGKTLALLLGAVALLLADRLRQCLHPAARSWNRARPRIRRPLCDRRRARPSDTSTVDRVSCPVTDGRSLRNHAGVSHRGLHRVFAT